MTLMERIRAAKIIVIVRGLPTEHMISLASALYAGGIRAIEVTFNQAKPETWSETTAAIRTLCEHFDGRIDVGAGTVMTPEQVHLAREAGAKYIISPNVNEAVIRETKKLGLLSFPGALTPTEAVFAHDCGADAIKLFPAGDMGPGYLKALAAPLAHIDFMAVGGITENNAADFMKAGAIGLGIGGGLVNKAWIEAGEFDRITALAEKYVKAVQ